MKNTEASIGSLQASLNELVQTTTIYTQDTAELFRLSEQLDQLIVKYYKEMSIAH
ncbi:MAG: Spo0E family sporulation regulatory protein-aspartic acid phosphatase [Cellulosilyticaceae bacterium]